MKISDLREALDGFDEDYEISLIQIPSSDGVPCQCWDKELSIAITVMEKKEGIGIGILFV